jgi:integrase
MPLTDTFVRQIKYTGKPVKYSDSRALHLLVKEAGKYWRMSYRFNGKQRLLALGVYPTITLAKARQLRDEARQLLSDGIDPMQAKRAHRLANATAAMHSFEVVARSWLSKMSSVRAPSTQKKNTLWFEKNVFPVIGKMPISSIGLRDVLAMLQRVENRGAIESAHKIKGLCGQVFRFAIAAGLADRDVTADLRGALSPVPKKHYAAITDPVQLGALIRSIREYPGSPYTRAALQLAPLCFLRPGELRQAEWNEFDLDAGEWYIPGSRMKMGKDHVVPLARQAVSILRTLHRVTGHSKYVFPNIRTNDGCLSENTINKALRRMGYGKEEMCGHGFRATARTILDEVLGQRPDLIEHQLAHAIRDPNGGAYNRTTHLPARKEMMQHWANYLDQIAIQDLQSCNIDKPT